MKQATWIRIGVVGVGLVVLGRAPRGVEEAAGQAHITETIIQEVEPNDGPLRAQAIPFPAPGEVVIFEGRVANRDRGSRADELNEGFRSSGPIQDWIVANPDALAASVGDGPLLLRITVQWVGAANLDVWVGTRIDEEVFFPDGFKVLSDDQMASRRQPESWPRSDAPSEAVALYLQPRGIIGNDGQPILNDGFGRQLVIGVQHVEGAAVQYQVTIEHEGNERAFSSKTHQVDDGLVSGGAFVNLEGELIVNRYRPSRYPAWLTAISHPFIHFPGLPDPTGHPIRVVVIAGESDAPLVEPPSQPSFVFDGMIPIPGTVEVAVDMVQIPIQPPLRVESGVVYVGFQVPAEESEKTGVLPVLDMNAVQYLRTWFSKDGGVSWRRLRHEEDVSGELVPLNAEIRATFEFDELSVSEMTNSSGERSNSQHR